MLIPTEATRVSVTRWLGRLVVQYLDILPNTQEIAKDLKNVAKVAKFRQIWPH